MSVVTLTIDSVLLLGIIGVSLRGAAILPAGAQLPMHFGPGGYTNWRPKNVGLVMCPAVGVVVFVILVTTARNQQANSGHGLPLPIGLTVALAILLANQVGAIRAALKRSGRN